MNPSFWIETGLAMSAGALLNLTPCVLPAVPIKVRTILREAGDTAGSRALSATLFTLGSVSFFAALGLLTALAHLQWGVLFQSRWVLTGLVLILVLLAAASFSRRSLPIPGALAQLGGARYFEPFASGMAGGILSTPCTGPLLGGVLVFALTRPTLDIVTLFVAIGLGMAMPYVLLLLHPSWLQRLPRAGAWTEVVRHSFGWLLLAAALFFVQSLLSGWLGNALWLVWLAALALWVVFVAIRARDQRSRWAAVLAALPALLLAYFGSGVWPVAGQGLPWQPLRADAVSQISALHRPALVEFTAAWCLNCRVMERTVYRDPAVLKAVRESGAIALQADLTRPDPALQTLLTRYGGAGLPFLAVLDSRGREVGHLSGLFTAGALIRRLHELPTSIVSTAAGAPRDSADEVGAQIASTPAGAVVTLDIARGWHVYSNPPSTPYLIPASLTVFRAGRALPITPRYPPGQDIGMRVEGKTILVYANGARIELPGLTDVRAVQVRVRVQACKDSGLCLPPATIVARPPSS